MRSKQGAKPDSLEAKYTNLAGWVLGGSWVEIGETDWTRTLVRALDGGGMIWEGKEKYKTLDEALHRHYA